MTLEFLPGYEDGDVEVMECEDANGDAEMTDGEAADTPGMKFGNLIILISEQVLPEKVSPCGLSFPTKIIITKD